VHHSTVCQRQDKEDWLWDRVSLHFKQFNHKLSLY
jgi:hypothetical protein